jgi:leucyl-tRNA synthetase
VSPDVSEEDATRLALASPAVVDALGGTPARRVIARPPKLVNVVP